MEFLRRMIGGELTADGFPVMNLKSAQKPSAPTQREDSRVLCDGSNRNPSSTDCPTALQAPSLAMVYAPRQCWRNLFSPAEGLANGTLFAELALPLEINPQKGDKEVKARRPM